MQLFFFQGWRVMTFGACPLFQSILAAPYCWLLTVFGPCLSSIRVSAFSSSQEFRQHILWAVFTLFFLSLICLSCYCSFVKTCSSDFFHLYPVKQLYRDNRLMVVFDIVLWRIPLVLDLLLREEVYGIGFLNQASPQNFSFESILSMVPGCQLICFHIQKTTGCNSHIQWLKPLILLAFTFFQALLRTPRALPHNLYIK